MDTSSTNRCQRIIDLIDARLAQYGTPAKPASALPVERTQRRNAR